MVVAKDDGPLEPTLAIDGEGEGGDDIVVGGVPRRYLSDGRVEGLTADDDGHAGGDDPGKGRVEAEAAEVVGGNVDGHDEVVGQRQQHSLERGVGWSLQADHRDRHFDEGDAAGPDRTDELAVGAGAQDRRLREPA